MSSRARHDASVRVDGVRLAPALEARPPDGRVDGERGVGASHGEADHAAPAGFIHIARAPAPLTPVPGHAPVFRREARVRPKFWGVSWNKGAERWLARYKDASGETRNIGYFNTQEQAAHAVNAAIRRAGLEGRRRTNPVVDGRLVPKKRKANGHGPPRKSRKRRHEEPAAAPAATRRARRPRRAVDYDDSEPDADEE